VTVYVDDMYRFAMGQFRNMSMSHMVADTEAELHAMADRIGVARRWYQGDHYDVDLPRRALAVQYGAREITMRQLASMVAIQRRTGILGKPETAEGVQRAWWRASGRTIRSAQARKGHQAGSPAKDRDG
jgi:hypothetical protein